MPKGDADYEKRVEEIMENMKKAEAQSGKKEEGLGSIFGLLGNTALFSSSTLAPKKEEKKDSFASSLGASAFGDLFGGSSLLSSYDSALKTSAVSGSTTTTATASKPATTGLSSEIFGGTSLLGDFNSILKDTMAKSSATASSTSIASKTDSNPFSASSIFGSSSIFGDLLGGSASAPVVPKPSETAKKESSDIVKERADKLVQNYQESAKAETAKDTSTMASGTFGSLFSGTSIFAGNSLFTSSSLLADAGDAQPDADKKKEAFKERITETVGNKYKLAGAFVTEEKDLTPGASQSKDSVSASLSSLLGSTSGLLSGAYSIGKVKSEEEKKKEFDERMKALGFGQLKAEEPPKEPEEKEPSEAERKKKLAEKMKKMMGGMDFSILNTKDDDAKALAGEGDPLALVDKYSVSEEQRKKKDEERLISIMREQLAAAGIMDVSEEKLRDMALGNVESAEEAKKRKDKRIKELTDANLRAQGLDPDKKFDVAPSSQGAYKDRVKELMRAKLKAKGLEFDESAVQIQDDSLSARVAEITRANLEKQGLQYQDGDLLLDDPATSQTAEEREAEMKKRVKEIMRKKLIEKGLDPDAAEQSEMSEEEAKAAFDKRVKELMRKKLAEKGINIDDTSIGDEVGLTPEEKKKRYDERVKRIMREKLEAKGIKVDADGNILDDEDDDKDAFNRRVKEIMAKKLAAKGVKIGPDGEPVYDLTEEEKKALFEKRVQVLLKTRLGKLGNITGLEAALALLDKDIAADNMSAKERQQRRQEAIQAKLAEMYEEQKKAEENRDAEANKKEDDEWAKTLEGLSEEEKEDAIKKREHELTVKMLVMDMMQVGKKRRRRNKAQLQEEIYADVQKRLPKVEDCEYKANPFVKGKCHNCKVSVYRHVKGDIPVEKPRSAGPVPVCESYQKPANPFMTKCQECGHPEKKHKSKAGKADAGAGSKAKKKACEKFVQHTNKFKQDTCNSCGMKESAHDESDSDSDSDGEEEDEYSYGDILAHCCGAASVQFSIEFMLEPFFDDSDSDSDSDSGSSSDSSSSDDEDD